MQKRLAQIKERQEVKQQDPLALAFDNYLETGFQLATFQGPLCAEPVEGLAYFVESVTLDREGIEQEQGMSNLLSRQVSILMITLSIEQNGAPHRLIHICRSRCLPKRFTRLVPEVDVSHVYV